MKMTFQKYSLLALVTALTVTGVTFAGISSAQTFPSLSCGTATPTVAVNQAAVLTATGGNGFYSWSGQSLSVNNPTGSQLTVSYPVAGIYLVNVTSAGQVASCTVSVVGSMPVGTLSCFPANQNAVVGQSVSVTASGGNGSYVWSSPELVINNATGSGFTANYASTGVKTLTVSSGFATAACIVNVLGNGSTGIPSLPNTGGGYGH